MICLHEIRKNLFLLGILLLAGIIWCGPADAGSPSFELTVVNTHQVISCDKLKLDPDSFRCKRGGVTYKYQKDAIESVSYNGDSIYPYDDSIELSESDLYEKDCDYLVKTIKSPLMLEENPDIFILVGTMYEKGICTRQNIQQAFTYYRRAGKDGMKKYADLRRKSS